MREIAGLFDKAMENPRWRDRYYVASIDGLLATAIEVNKHQKESRNGGQPYSDLLCSSHADSSFLTAKSNQPSGPSSSTGSVHRTQSLGRLPSSSRTTMSLSEASVEELLAAIVDWSKCPICGRTFKKIDDQKHNLSRHIKTQHGDFGTFECPDPNCRLIYKTKYNRDRHAKGHQRKSMSSTGLLSPGYADQKTGREFSQRLSRSLSQ